MTRAHGAMLLLGFSLFIGSCSTDPTTSDEYLQLADEKSSVESDLAESLRYGSRSGSAGRCRDRISRKPDETRQFSDGTR